MQLPHHLHQSTGSKLLSELVPLTSNTEYTPKSHAGVKDGGGGGAGSELWANEAGFKALCLGPAAWPLLCGVPGWQEGQGLRV